MKVLLDMCIQKENCNLIQTSQKLIKMKKIRGMQTFAGIIVMIIWVIWFDCGLYNSVSLNSSPSYKGAAIRSLFGSAIGAVIGLIIGYLIFRKMQKTNDKLIEQIKDITNNK